MEMTWNNMEKKEKLMWIKKAAEDQKRYEVGRRLGHPLHISWGSEPEVPALVVTLNQSQLPPNLGLIVSSVKWRR